MTVSSRGITYPITLTITTRTITTRTLTRTITTGATYDLGSGDNATVQAVQTQLFNLGYYSGSIDGVFGPTTRDAVAKYQIANHLNVTGSLSADTIQALGLLQRDAKLNTDEEIAEYRNTYEPELILAV